MYTHALRNSDSSSWVAAHPLASFKPSSSYLWLILSVWPILFWAKILFFLSARGKHLLVDRGHVLSFSCLSAFKGKPCCQKVQSVSSWSCCASWLLSGTFRLHPVWRGLRTPNLHGQFLLLCFLSCLWFFWFISPSLAWRWNGYDAPQRALWGNWLPF